MSYSEPDHLSVGSYRSHIASVQSIDYTHGYGSTSGMNEIGDKLTSITNSLDAAVAYSPGSGSDES